MHPRIRAERREQAEKQIEAAANALAAAAGVDGVTPPASAIGYDRDLTALYRWEAIAAALERVVQAGEALPEGTSRRGARKRLGGEVPVG